MLRLTKPRYILDQSSKRWLAFYLDSIAAAIVACLSACIVAAPLFPSAFPGASIGVAAACLTGVMQLTLLLNWFVRTSAEMESMAAAGAHMSYSLYSFHIQPLSVFTSNYHQILQLFVFVSLTCIPVQRIMKWFKDDCMGLDASSSFTPPSSASLHFRAVSARYNAEEESSELSAKTHAVVSLALIEVTFSARAG